jgi:hypothetical protein
MFEHLRFEIHSNWVDASDRQSRFGSFASVPRRTQHLRFRPETGRPGLLRHFAEEP